MAPATPPPSSKSLFAAFTMASVSISVRSPCWIMIFCANSVEIILLFSLFVFVVFFPFLRVLVLGIGKFPFSFVGLFPIRFTHHHDGLSHPAGHLGTSSNGLRGRLGAFREFHCLRFRGPAGKPHAHAAVGAKRNLRQFCD